MTQLLMAGVLAKTHVSSVPDIPAPTFYFTPQANGSAANTAGCVTLTGIGANLPLPTTGIQGDVWTIAGNGSRRLRGNGTPTWPGNTPFTLAMYARVQSTGTQVGVSTITPGSGGPFVLYWDAGTASAGVTLSNGTFRVVTTRCELLSWHFFVMQWTPAGNLTLSVDGIRSSSILTAGGPLQATGGNITFGSHVDGTVVWTGNIGAVAMWLGNDVQPNMTQLQSVWQNGQGRLFGGTTWNINDTDYFPTGSFAGLFSPPGKNVILSTDIGGDIDDAMDAYLCLYGHQQGLLTLKAMVTDGPLDKGTPCLQAFRDYSGLTSIPLGAYQGNAGFIANITPITDSYANSTANQFGLGALTRANYTNANEVMYNALANCADNSTIVVMTGFGTAFDSLLRMANGTAMVAAKCTWVIWSSGEFTGAGSDPPYTGIPPTTIEWNYYFAPGPAASIVANCPVPILYSPFVNGVISGGKVGATIAGLPVGNPMRVAQGLFWSGNFAGTREPWGPLAVWPTLFGLNGYMHLTDPSITNTIAVGNGQNTWSGTAGNATGQLLVRPGVDYVAVIDPILGTDIA